MDSQYSLGVQLGNHWFPHILFQLIVEQLIAGHSQPGHSMAAALVYTAQDISRVAQASKSMRDLAQALGHHLSDAIEAQLPVLPRQAAPWDRPCELLPRLPSLDWVRALEMRAVLLSNMTLVRFE